MSALRQGLSVSDPPPSSLPFAPSEAVSADNGEPWHAIWTRSRNEPLVCSELRSKGIECFLPTMSRVSRWTDRSKRILWPLFPGYCFARFPTMRLVQVLSCTGVVTVLSNGGKPVPLPHFEIDALKRLVSSGLEYDPCSALEPGSRVRVIRGPLDGVIGCLVRRPSHDQLILAVEMLSSGARLTVSPWDVEPL